MLIALDQKKTLGAGMISEGEFLMEHREFDPVDFGDALVDLAQLELIDLTHTTRDKVIGVTDRGSLRATEIQAERVASGMLEEVESIGVVPASDRVVDLDHNSAAVAAVKEAVDDTLSAVKQSNEVGSEEPQEKERIEAELEAGQRLLKAKRVDLGKLVAVLFRVLRFIAERFFGSAAAKAADRAIDLLEKLFESLT
ncbi:hypothetical protein NUH88_15945 [Nisaea acidiphila]|uniref:Uncharacterized protein n=1 Tax=Nisaea acidiphila TaxID=1862145 RepID=A0A9J7ANZ2_9PROT|nr:hypothetical protein [Nisaea acidiphila]UUX48886.1 hypothetical protein NUH88_15945 [Nisaea acidiphila]